jgi:3-hydroxyisobutyrate dehydrogenase-like beta-hydroxyacid dehydrogenase
MSQSKVGLVGLGLMGTAMAKRLAAAGHPLTGFDIDPSRVRRAEGVTPAASAAAVAAATDIILVSVIDTAAVRDAVLGPSGIASAGDVRGKVVVDLSTTEIDATKEIAAALTAKGAALVDAPVSGGPDLAKLGTLAIMAGGEADAVGKAAAVLARLGKLAHMGPSGTGQATKLVNQTLALTQYCVYAEALRLAEAFGVDASKIPQALGGGFAGSNLLPVAFPRMVEEDFAPRGYARQVLKDLEMLNTAAKSHHLAMPMSAQALTLYRLLVSAGHGELDAGAIVKLYPKKC